MSNYKTKVDNNGRECTHCYKYKTWEHYISSASSSTGYKSLCKECDRNYQREWAAKRKEIAVPEPARIGMPELSSLFGMVIGREEETLDPRMALLSQLLEYQQETIRTLIEKVE